ncbi:DNA-binding protein [Thiolapillus sp.]|uniref:DNA-binding protein n=1 Tax=Thiolapillus sp. TaxID=2017437 RepID=UPI0025F17A8D|nr:DNA-binding protein [Thiolapillus sp.]
MVQMSKEVRNRIFAAADDLYERGGREGFPTVDAVRKAARVNMNDASAAMKEWRRAQISQASPLAVQVPELVMQAAQSFVGSLWAQAQELANESQAVELEQAASRLTELEKSEATAKADVADLRGKVAEVGERAATSEARASELRAELNHAHADVEKLRAERDKALEAVKVAQAEHRAEIKEMRSEFDAVRATSAKERDRLSDALSKAEAQLQYERDQFAEQRKQTAQEVARQADRYIKLQADLDASRKDARASSEEAARLRGRVEVLEQVLNTQEHKKLR